MDDGREKVPACDTIPLPVPVAIVVPFLNPLLQPNRVTSHTKTPAKMCQLCMAHGNRYSPIEDSAESFNIHKRQLCLVHRQQMLVCNCFEIERCIGAFERNGELIPHVNGCPSENGERCHFTAKGNGRKIRVFRCQDSVLELLELSVSKSKADTVILKLYVLLPGFHMKPNNTFFTLNQTNKIYVAYKHRHGRIGCFGSAGIAARKPYFVNTKVYNVPVEKLKKKENKKILHATRCRVWYQVRPPSTKMETLNEERIDAGTKRKRESSILSQTFLEKKTVFPPEKEMIAKCLQNIKAQDETTRNLLAAQDAEYEKHFRSLEKRIETVQAGIDSLVRTLQSRA